MATDDHNDKADWTRMILRWALGAFLLLAGSGHLTWARRKCPGGFLWMRTSL